MGIIDRIRPYVKPNSNRWGCEYDYIKALGLKRVEEIKEKLESTYVRTINRSKEVEDE